MYDIIGDIHGHADELVSLLEKMDYRETNGCFRHENRTAVFCGDFVDRGPQIPDVVRIVKAMVESEAAKAVMGNHEFNALAYHTEDPTTPGVFLRPHHEKNMIQHAKTVEQFSEADLQEALEWFATLPPALDLGVIRAVHACWDSAGIATINDAIAQYGAYTPEFLAHATDRHDPLFAAVERVMKGPELALAEGVTVTDKEGNARRRVRIRWFDAPDNHTLNTYALPAELSLTADRIPASAPAVPYPDDAPPVFVGHYWLPEAVPQPLKHNVACLDYSVAKHGLLCAYRFDGKATLSADRFVTVPSRDRKDVP